MAITEEDIKKMEADENKEKKPVVKPKSKSQKKRLDVQTGTETTIENLKSKPTSEEEIATLQAKIIQLTEDKEIDAVKELGEKLKEKAEEFKPLAPKKEKIDKIDKIEEKKIFVSLDFTPEMVLSYYKEGYELFFESDVGRFRVLDDEVIESFDTLTRSRYVNSFYLNKKAIEVLKAPPSGIKYSSQLASATATLQIDNKKPDMHYSWIAPALMREAVTEGSRVCEDPDVITLHCNKENVHRVGVMGNTELVLMETTKEIAQTRLKKISDASRARKEGIVEQGIQDLRRGGHQAFNPKTDEDPRKHHFGSIKQEPSKE